MTIAANVLLALGGQPVIDRPGFIPAYPSTLPMSIGDGLTVGLAKFSLDLVRDVFMKIEEPETAIEFPVGAAEAALATGPAYATIGEFYRAIIDKIVAFGDRVFMGDPGRQVVDPRWFPTDELFRITDVETARQALLLVVEEGEGTTQSPLDPEGDYAHYYRFAEIWHGRRLVPESSIAEGYAYAGALLPFAADAVWDMPPNPKASGYPAGSLSRQLTDQFSFTYTKLLKALHAAFNGTPESSGERAGHHVRAAPARRRRPQDPRPDNRPIDRPDLRIRAAEGLKRHAGRMVA